MNLLNIIVLALLAMALSMLAKTLERVTGIDYKIAVAGTLLIIAIFQSVVAVAGPTTPFNRSLCSLLLLKNGWYGFFYVANDKLYYQPYLRRLTYKVEGRFVKFLKKRMGVWIPSHDAVLNESQHDFVDSRDLLVSGSQGSSYGILFGIIRFCHALWVILVGLICILYIRVIPEIGLVFGGVVEIALLIVVIVCLRIAWEFFSLILIRRLANRNHSPS